MSLDVLGAKQSTLNRPNDPLDPNGIAHATDSADTGDGVATKASRAAAKIAWANYVQDYREAYRAGDSAGPAVFPDNGEIDYADDTTAFVNPTLTVGSAVSIVAQSPFAGGGNSYSFISSVNSFIDTPASSDWAVGTGDFTIEWFSYQTTLSGFQRAFTVDDFASIDIGSSIENGAFYYWANDGFRYNSSAASSADVWTHWAIVRASGITKVYKNGVQRGSQITDTNNITNTVDELTIGNENTASTIAAFVGYITNFRWIKGLAVYTGNFTVPTSELTATASANPYGGSNTQAIPSDATKLLLVP